MDEQLYQLGLTYIPGIGDVLIKQLISYCGSASVVFNSSPAKLLRVPGIGEVIAHNIRRHHDSALREAEQERKRADQYGVQLLFYTDASYPARLKRLYDSPVLLYYQGNADLNTTRTIAIVGTRKATDYGKAITETIVGELQKYAPLIISGLAYGIDIAAHRACLKHQVATLGVMATGMDIVYPGAHLKTAHAMRERGGLLTESRMGAQAEAPRFPARNRIIAGLCDALIVVEAAIKGGALITAEYANNYHKDVFAVPGDVDRPSSVGCNRLIQQNKAAIYTSISDLLAGLPWETSAAHTLGSSATPGEAKSTKQTTAPAAYLAEGLIFTEEESQVIAMIRAQREALMDDLSWKLQIPVSRMASLLLNLEFQGVVKALPGKKFVLN